MQDRFCREHCAEFEDSDENKLVYTGAADGRQQRHWMPASSAPNRPLPRATLAATMWARIPSARLSPGRRRRHFPPVPDAARARDRHPPPSSGAHAAATASPLATRPRFALLSMSPRQRRRVVDSRNSLTPVLGATRALMSFARCLPTRAVRSDRCRHFLWRSSWRCSRSERGTSRRVSGSSPARNAPALARDRTLLKGHLARG